MAGRDKSFVSTTEGYVPSESSTTLDVSNFEVDICSFQWANCFNLLNNNMTAKTCFLSRSQVGAGCWKSPLQWMLTQKLKPVQWHHLLVTFLGIKLFARDTAAISQYIKDELNLYKIVTLLPLKCLPCTYICTSMHFMLLSPIPLTYSSGLIVACASMQYTSPLSLRHCVTASTLNCLWQSIWSAACTIVMVFSYINWVLQTGYVYNHFYIGMDTSNTVQEYQTHSSDKDIQPQPTTTGTFIFVIISYIRVKFCVCVYCMYLLVQKHRWEQILQLLLPINHSQQWLVRMEWTLKVCLVTPRVWCNIIPAGVPSSIM